MAICYGCARYSINMTTKDPAFLHSLLLTNHFGHFRQHDSTKKKGKRYNLGEIISKKSPQCFTNADTRVGISQLRNLYQAEAYHISCLYLPRCNGRYDNRSAWRKLKQHALMPPKGERMKRWLVFGKTTEASSVSRILDYNHTTGSWSADTLGEGI